MMKPLGSKKRKLTKKKIVVFVILAVLLVLLVYGLSKVRAGRNKAYVQPVMDMNNNWVLQNETSSGRISDKAAQTISLDPTDIVSKVYVEEGQKVSKGDPLFQYDTVSLQLDLEDAQLSVTSDTQQLDLEKQKLEQYKKIKPVAKDDKDAEEPELPEDPYALSAEQKLPTASGGTGTKADPKVYKCTTDTIITAEDWEVWQNAAIVPEVKPGKDTAGKDGSGKDAADKDSSKKDGTDQESTEISGAGKTDTSADDEGDGTFAEASDPYYWVELQVDSETYVFDVMKQNIYLGDGIAVSAADSVMGQMISTVALADVAAGNAKEPEVNPDDMQTTYTQKEKDKLISDQQNTITKLENGIELAKISVTKAKQKLDDATVKALVPGIVKSIADPANPPKDGSPFCSITAESGVALTGYISELDLAKTSIGDKVSISSWTTGTMTDATITSLSDYPTTSSDAYGNGNPNVSYYEYTAFMEDSEGFEIGEDVSVQPYIDGVDQLIVLEKVYVRSDKDGNFCMVDDGSGRLKKQRVKVGKTYEGQYVEVVSGLNQDDLLAFPYGKASKTGTLTTTQPVFSLF